MSTKRKSVALPNLLALFVFCVVLDGPVLAGVPDLLVSSSATDNVLRYDAAGTFVGEFASGGGLDTPTGLDFGPDGNLYVCSQDTKSDPAVR